MAKYRVLVYMTTYNGARFVAEQISSIYMQEEVDVDILIADDCSNDETCQIIESMACSNVKLIRNERNKGYRRNFMELIQFPVDNEYDYFALSDQDDVWLPKKIISAIHKLEQMPGNEPNLYCSNLKLVDAELNPLGKNLNPLIVPNVYHFLLENICTGCTTVFNKNLRELLVMFPSERMIVPHDEVIGRIALLCGNFLYDNDSYILYRQHGKNAIGANTNSKLLKYLYALRTRKSFKHADNLADIESIFKKNIKQELSVWLEGIAGYKNTFTNMCGVIFHRCYSKRTFIKTLLFKVAILIRVY